MVKANHALSNSAQFVKCCQIFLELNAKRPYQTSSGKEKESCCCFARLNLLLFCRSCCRRRRRWLRSLISMETLIVFPLAPVQIHMTTVQGLFSFNIRHIYARTCALALNLQQCKRSSLLNVVTCMNYARATKYTRGLYHGDLPEYSTIYDFQFAVVVLYLMRMSSQLTYVLNYSDICDQLYQH